jgi:hypothetical protein
MIIKVTVVVNFTSLFTFRDSEWEADTNGLNLINLVVLHMSLFLCDISTPGNLISVRPKRRENVISFTTDLCQR